MTSTAVKAITDMGTRPGNKIYIQVLLDPARASFLQQIAEEKGVKLSALAREAIYSWVISMTEPEAYKAAEVLDQAQWRESVQNRIDGRKRNREMRMSLQEVS